VTFKVSVMKCTWIDVNTSVRNDEVRFTLVDLNKFGYMDEPFVMTYQAIQIYFH